MLLINWQALSGKTFIEYHLESESCNHCLFTAKSTKEFPRFSAEKWSLQPKTANARKYVTLIIKSSISVAAQTSLYQYECDREKLSLWNNLFKELYNEEEELEKFKRDRALALQAFEDAKNWQSEIKELQSTLKARNVLLLIESWKKQRKRQQEPRTN